MWEESFVVVSVVLGVPPADAASALEDPRDAGDIAARLGDVDRARRSRALAVALAGVVSGADSLVLA